MKRAERRYQTQKIAWQRAMRYPGDSVVVGRYRKWNMTCRCKICLIDKHGDIQLQRMKDERRNRCTEGA